MKIKDKNILIDTGSREIKQELLQDLKSLNITPEKIDILIMTHNHWDHNGNLELFSKEKIYQHSNINKLPVKEFKIYKVPGHTRNSIAILYNEFLFSGDTLFHNGIGRTDLRESIPEKIDESLKFLRSLPYKTLCPGHI